MSDTWRGVVNAVLYKVQFADALGDDEVRRISGSLVHQPLWDLTVEDEYRALVEGLDSGEDLDPVVQANFSEADKRSFLTRIVGELDDMRPWPVRPYREIPLDRWAEFIGLDPIARIDLSWTDIQPLLGKMFRKPTGYNREVLLLHLKSGAEVGFLWPGWGDRAATELVARGEKLDASSIVQELLSVSGLDPVKVTVLAPAETATTLYEVIPLRPEFVGEHIPGNDRWNGTHVRYLAAAERSPYKLTVENGLLYDSRGNLFDTTTARTLWTPQGGRAIFVMDENGDIYSSPDHVLGRFHHSSLLAGSPVAAAGEIAAENGRILLISDHSTPLPPTPPLHPPGPRQPPPPRNSNRRQPDRIPHARRITSLVGRSLPRSIPPALCGAPDRSQGFGPVTKTSTS
ncbi:hypothetical protein [Nocardia yunnanensis]|nr:hypothetical protein [Nocardia yunnanensis]